MEENNFNYQEEVLKAGLLVGFASVFIVLITYIINFEISLEWWYGLLTLSVTIGLVIFSIGTVVVAFGETFVRTIIKKKIDQEPLETTVQTSSFTEPSGIWQDPLRPN